ncbi:MAG: nucleoside permease [Bryobacteraceae bacterium]
MPVLLRVQLSVMMLLEYVIWGAWYVTLTTYLTATLHFSGTQAGAVFGTTALACMISPFFVGRIADRLFAIEHVLALLHLVGALILFLLTRVTSFTTVYGLMLAYCLCYFPTMSLANTLAFRNIKNLGKEFPLIRVFGTIGWILIGLVVGGLRIERTSKPFLLAAIASLAMSFFCLSLPHTPPAGKGQVVSARTMLGLDALVMLKSRSFAVFVIASVLACIPLTFYFSFTNAYLNAVGVVNAAGKMTLGQFSEIGMMLVMPFVFKKVNVKGVLLVGLFAWTLRYLLLAFGNAGSGVWMFYVAILVHGICYDFFFMTGQMYTDQKAPPHLRGTAQGLITFVTYGLGMLVGAQLSGSAVDYFTELSGKVNWMAFWWSSAGSALLIFLFVLLFFKGGEKIHTRAEEMAAVRGD